MVPKSSTLCQTMYPRDALKISVEPEDVIALQPSGSGQFVAICVFDESGRHDPSLLGLQGAKRFSIADFDSDEMTGWLAAHGALVQNEVLATHVELNGPVFLRTQKKCTVWALRICSADALVLGRADGGLELSVKSAAAGSNTPLPPVLGDIRDEFTVRRGTAISYEVAQGEYIQIIDVEGQQCSDFMALLKQPLDVGREMTIDSTVTRSMVRGAYPTPGLLDKFFDAEMRPMLRVIQDTCGRHDTFGVACTARGYEERGFPGHLNCSDNISFALERFGVKSRAAWPAINFFWNTWVDETSHHLLTEESYSRPGDYVVMKALQPLVCASTACPDDIDPINGWNPTDVHVRIYHPETRIRRAVAYREKEDAPMSLSQHSAFHPATSKLTSQFAPARDLWAPVTYPATGTIGEYWACRNNVTLQDMSSLRKYDVVGPDAERLLQLAMTKDVAKIAVWRGAYALMCDESGAVIDDGTLFRMAPDLFRWCCGTEESARHLKALADGANLQVRIHDLGGALPNLALQGPRSREVLERLVFTQPTVPSLENLKWFGATVARVGDRDGLPFMLTRSGYTGELGYELFCSAEDAVRLWDALMSAGEALGIKPMGAAALEIIRIEAGLAAANAEFAAGVDAYEAGLGFAINLSKAEFHGKAALERNAQDQRKVLRGLWFECDDVPVSGAHVFAGERPVGTITSATRSPMFERTIAMARLNVEHADVGTSLEVGQMDGRIKRLPVTVVETPFFDPKRERARA